MLWYWVFLIIGVILLIKGADFFVDGSSNIAKLIGIPSLVVGLTLVSMGTSAPETSVSIQAALAGSNDISLGNVLGSNIANSALILGLSALIAPIAITKSVKYYDIPVMVGISAILVLFCYVITPSHLELWEGIILLVIFVGYLAFLVIRSRKEIKAERDAKISNKANEVLDPEEVEKKKINLNFIVEGLLFCALVVTAIVFYLAISPNKFELWESIIIVVLFALYVGLLAFRLIKNYLNKKKEKSLVNSEKEAKTPAKPASNAQYIIKSIILVALGLCGVIFGGTLVVDNAKAIASELGMSEALVGLTIVAVGTSLPELVTSIVAAVKKENDIAIGNVVGSNIFNIMLVLGLSSVISPIAINPDTLIDGIIVVGLAVIILFFCLFAKKLKRWQGGVLTVLYVGYIVYVITRELINNGAI